MLASRLFNLHPIYRGIEAATYSRLKLALHLAADPQTRDARIENIRRCFREGGELLRWLLSPRSETARDEIVSGMIKQVLASTLPAGKQVEAARIALKRPRGRPQETRKLAVYALEAKLARPEATWEQITAPACRCTKPKHDSYCAENLESQVRRLKSLLRRTGVASEIIARAKHPTLRRNLQTMLGQKS
jgi:hypothetical protein